MSIQLTRISSGRLQLPVSLAAVAFALGSFQDLGRREGRLSARPRTVSTTMAPGLSVLSIGRDRDGQLYVPPAAKAGPVPLMVLLHGAGGSSQGIRRRLLETTDSIEFAVLVPDSRGPTWDAIRGDYGPDIAFIDSALKIVFARVSIDPTRVTVAGFSDGASYALALGRINGDLFSRVVAFSPGFVPPSIPMGKPEVLITHGNADPILPFAATSQRIAPALKKAGYVVTLKQFDGGHTIPPDLARVAFLWAAGPREVKSPR